VIQGWYRLCLWPAAAWLILAAAGYVPTRHWGGGGGLEAMFAALAVVGVVVYGTMMPSLRRMAELDGPGRLRLGLKVAGVRFALTAAIGVVVAWRGPVQPTVFLVWLGISYLVLIKIETLTLIYWAGKLDKNE
jgi:hypothetical protein